MRIVGHLDDSPGTGGEMLFERVHIHRLAIRRECRDDRHGLSHLGGVPVRVQPVQRGTGRRTAIRAGTADNHQRVGEFEDRGHGAVQNPGAAVGQQDRVVALQNVVDSKVVGIGERLRDLGVVRGREHIQAAVGL